jgi:two-component system OmpR family sensor kinase
MPEYLFSGSLLRSAMPFSFRTRLAVWYMLVLAALLATASVMLIYTLQGMAERRLDATLWILGATEAEGIASRLRDRGLRSPDDLTVYDIDYRDFAGYEEFREQKYVTVVDRVHRIVDFSNNLPNHPLPLRDELVSRALRGEVSYDTTNVAGVGVLRMIYIPVTGQQMEPFLLVLGVPTKPVGTEVGVLTRRVAAAIIFILALTGLSGLLLGRRALRPVADTAVAVQRITDRNLNERLPETKTNDEIGYLIKVFNQLLARLDNAFETQRRFTADASHEICTPLTVLKGDTEVALLERRTPEEYEAILRSNLEEIERLSKLTSNLLLLARADAGEQQITKDVLILNELVAESCYRLRTIADERGIEMRLNLSDLVPVEGDQAALQQVIVNLISNALRYTPRDGCVQLDLRLTPQGTARFEVTDTGMGIPSEALPHIFERFYRASNARAQEPTGLGLGLAICRAMAEAHGGHLEVESRTGEGSRFTLILPALVVEDQQAEFGI